MNWLREHMRGHITAAARTEPEENILDFPGHPPLSPGQQAPAALDLVSEAAEMIRGIQDRAAKTEAQARALAESAMEKLKLADARIQSAEAERNKAQEALSKVSARLREAEGEVARTRSRIAALEAQLANAEQRVKSAETRAVRAEKAVEHVEEAIRTQLLGLQTNLTGGSSRAA
jgi:chromosome segregation ATPase